MHSRLVVLGSLLALPLTACADGRDAELPAAETNAQGPRITMRNDHHDRLMRAAFGDRQIAMMRAIRRTGNRCQRVDNAGYQQEYRDMRMWVAQCGVEGRTFAVFIAPNGDVQVRDCAHAGQLALPRCEGLPPAPPPGSNLFQEGASDKAYRNQF